MAHPHNSHQQWRNSLVSLARNAAGAVPHHRLYHHDDNHAAGSKPHRPQQHRDYHSDNDYDRYQQDSLQQAPIPARLPAAMVTLPSGAQASRAMAAQLAALQAQVR